MDFLDPKKERQSQFKLLLGYCLVALAIGGAALVLLYQADGYQLNRQGEVTQSGLLFVSSQPANASIFLNGQQYASNTSTRVTTSAGAYNLSIARSGYRDWSRPVYVAGGDVQHFDYPFLFPKKLTTTPVTTVNSVPSMATQSSDQRWMLVDRPNIPGAFTLFDMKAPAAPVSSPIVLPTNTFTPSDGEQSWSVEEWSTDNRHVVLVHNYVSKTATDHEYILLDRQDPTNSVNLTYSLNLAQNESLALFNNQIDQVYVFNKDSQTLQRMNVSNGVQVSKLDHVIAYKSYADNKILYVTDTSLNGKITDGTVNVVLQDGQKSYTLRTLPADSPSYVLNLAQYSGDWYIAVGVSNGTSVYIYKDPESQPTVSLDSYPDPWRRLDIPNPTDISFSNNTQFLEAESGQHFIVYDLENVIQYSYTSKLPLDQPQSYVGWMDGNRLMYVSGDKLVVFDYDHRNQQTLMTADAQYVPVFDSSYRYLYALIPNPKDDSSTILTSTPVRAPADL